MALSSMTKSLCNSLQQKFDPLVRPANDLASGFKSQLRSFISQLEGATFNPHNIISSTLSTLESQVNAITPTASMSDMEDLRDFIEHCTFFSAPVPALNGGLEGLFNQIDDYITGTGVIEFNLGSLADSMNNLLSTNKISEDLYNANRLLDCMDRLCPDYNISEKLDYLNSLKSQYNLIIDPLTSTYVIDYDSIYDSAGLSSAEKEGMNIAVNGITSIKQNALTSVNSSIEKVKSLVKIGGFF